MSYQIKIILAILIFSLALPVFAESLSWRDCIKETINNHPDLIAAFEKVKQAKADKAIALSDVLPQITSSSSAKRSKTSTRDEADTYSYSISAEQLLFDGFKASSDIKSAQETLSAQQYNYAVTSSDIRLNLRTAFTTLLRAQELVALTEEIVKRRKQNLDLVNMRYEAGREHKGSLLTAQADMAQAEFEVSQAKRNLILTQRQLSKELGREDFKAIKAEGDFAIKEDEHTKPVFENLASTAPFLKELIAKKEAARLNLKSSQLDFFPKVYLNSSYGKTASEWPPNQEEWSAGLAVTFPIFEGGSRIVNVSKTKSQFNQARAEERSGRDSVIITLEETWKNLQDAIDTVLVQQKFLEAAEERAKISNAQYSSGLISFDDWIIIEGNLVSAKKSFLNARANLLIAEAGWVQAKGGTLEYD